MAFILTQTQAFSEAARLAPEILASLRPHIAGPQADLHRYASTNEKPGINIGPYVSAADTAYPWPSRAAGTVVDLDYTRVFIDEAFLKYFDDNIGSGDTITPSGQNKIVTTGLGWKKNGAFNRKTALGDRDVLVGDQIWISDNGANSMFSYVAELIADVVAAVIAAATSDSGNAATQSFAQSAVQTGGVVNDITAAPSCAGYDGLAQGDINETYTITFTQGGAPGVALFNVVSGSGNDNQTGITPAAFSTPTSIGTRGAQIIWSHVVDNFVAGQRWLLTIAQAFTAPSATSGGSYTGTIAQGNIKYIIEVTKGGFYANSPEITVTSDNGTDASGPTVVPAAATNVACGTRGVLVQFNNTALRKGDRYYIQVTGPTTGAYRTIRLGNNMPAALQTAPDLHLRLFIKKNIEVPRNRISTPPLVNWVAAPETITIKADIDAYDTTLTSGGVPFAVPVVSGPNTRVYVQHRDWMADNAQAIRDITVDPGGNIRAQVEAVLGTADPDNPLSFAVFKAAQNANGNPIYYSGILDRDDIAEWQNILDLLVGIKGVRQLVPLTRLQAVHDAYKAHVNAQAAEEVGGEWRVAWLPLQAVTSTAIVDQSTTTDHNVAMATVTDDPSMAGTQFTLVNCTTGNAKFVTRGVRPGDIFRCLFSADPFGGQTYQEFVVSVVNNEDQLLLVSGPSVAISVAAKFEIWRNLTRNESAALLVSEIEATANKRVNFVWPDLINVGSELEDGFFLCAALASLSGAIMPHQGLQSLEVVGFDDVTRSTSFFSNGQLNQLAEAGCVVVTKDNASGMVYVRNDRTSDQSSVVNGQEGVVRNEDAIRYAWYRQVASFFGQANNTPTAWAMIESEIITITNIIQTTSFVDRLGSMIVSVNDLAVRAHATLPDVVVITATVDRPVALDAAEIIITFV